MIPAPALRSTACTDCPIRHRAVCARCDDDEFRRLERMKYYRSVAAGQTIQWQGDRLDSVASLVRGVAALRRTTEDGRTQMLGLLLPSDFIGRPGRDRALHDVVAVTDVTLCCFARGPFEALIGSSHGLSRRLLEMTLDELDAAREWMFLLGRKTAREKVATFIRMLLRRRDLPGAGLSGAGPGPDLVDLELTRDAMADFLGLTLETVSRQVSALKRAGVIRLHGARLVEIRDPHGLARAAGEEAPAA